MDANNCNIPSRSPKRLYCGNRLCENSVDVPNRSRLYICGYHDEEKRDVGPKGKVAVRTVEFFFYGCLKCNALSKYEIIKSSPTVHFENHVQMQQFMVANKVGLKLVRVDLNKASDIDHYVN